MFLQRFEWAVLIPESLSPRDQPALGTVWLHACELVR